MGVVVADRPGGTRGKVGSGRTPPRLVAFAAMSVGKRTGLALALACLGLGVAGAGTAHTAPAEIAAADGCCRFIDGPFEQPRGEVARFVNPAGASAIHNVFAVAPGPDGRKLFYSETIRPGSESPVAGTQYLRTGDYPFVCTVHPGMDGSLRVTGAGTPVARPAISVAVLGQRRAAVARKGSLRISLSSPTGVRGARVKIRVGRKVIGAVRSISVSPGGKRAITAGLSPQGKAILSSRKSVAVTVSASVSFGKPSSAKKVLR